MEKKENGNEKNAKCDGKVFSSVGNAKFARTPHELL